MIDPPEWAHHADAVLGAALRSVRLLGAVTPIDAAKERARLIDAFAAGRSARPEWRYPRVDCEPARRALGALVSMLARDDHPLAACYVARAKELDLEARLSELAGQRDLADLARTRFGPRDAAARADDLARAWIELREDPAPRATHKSDSPSPSSLLSRMRAEVGRLRLPFAVETHASLAPLAATGERTILIAEGRDVDDEDAARTVLHEIEGHAAPRARAAHLRPGIFSIGTAGGADDQEGRALLLEKRSGFLTARRSRQLAARHIAARAMLDGASFVEVTETLINVHQLPAADAVLFAERVFRGSDGESAGLGRERVYLEALLRVTDHLARAPEDERVLERGQVAIDQIPILRPYVD